MDSTEHEVWEAVEAANRCWTTGRAADLYEHFHETMVAITPADRLPLVGREACVSAWTKYAETTKILSWRTRDPRVRIYGDAAVVTYRYEMTGERDGKSIRPAGRDLMVLIRDAGRWQVVADQFSPCPGEGDP